MDGYGWVDGWMDRWRLSHPLTDTVSLHISYAIWLLFCHICFERGAGAWIWKNGLWWVICSFVQFLVLSACGGLGFKKE